MGAELIGGFKGLNRRLRREGRHFLHEHRKEKLPPQYITFMTCLSLLSDRRIIDDEPTNALAQSLSQAITEKKVSVIIGNKNRGLNDSISALKLEISKKEGKILTTIHIPSFFPQLCQKDPFSQIRSLVFIANQVKELFEGKTAIGEVISNAEQAAEHLMLKSIGDRLLKEGLEYNRLKFLKPKMFMTPKGSNHLNYVIHDEQIPPFISIHFRSGLKKLAPLELIKRWKEFNKNLQIDFFALVQEFTNNPKLKDVKLIYGLTNLPAKWGKKYGGFSTATYSDDPNILALHGASIAGMNVDTTSGPLTLFWMTKEKLFETFGKPVGEKSPS